MPRRVAFEPKAHLRRLNGKTTAMFRLIHLSDTHQPPLPPLPARAFFSKRVSGYLNWMRGRRNVHLADVLEKTRNAIVGMNADHIAVTGDLTNLALPAELKQSRSFLESFGKPENVTAIPGNHDAYVLGALEDAVAAWAPFMTGDGQQKPHFPFVRRRSKVSLIGLNSAVPKPFFVSAGELGDVQRNELARVLEDEGERGAFRIVLIHHPPLEGLDDGRRKRLTDAPALTDILKEKGVELVLYGHVHRYAVTPLSTSAGEALIIGTPSASIAADPRRKKPGGFLSFEIGNTTPGHWDITVERWGVKPGSPEAEEFSTEKRGLERTRLPAPAHTGGPAKNA